METYDTLRYFVSLASLVAMFVLFIGVVLFLFRPGSKKVHVDSSRMIFRNDDRPLATDDAARPDQQEAR